MAESPYQWIWDFEREARRNNDAERLRLVSFYGAAQRVDSKFPKEKFALYTAGHDLAQRLGEPWWEMFYEGWCIETLLLPLTQPELALDRAIRAVLEISKPAFIGFPQRSSLEINLAAAYSRIDPIGYEVQLRALFAHLQSHTWQFAEDKAYYAQVWSKFLIDVEDLGAVDAAFDYLRCAQEVDDNRDFYTNHALILICKALYLFDREDAHTQIRDLAKSGEEVSRRLNDANGTIKFLVWRSVAAHWDGNNFETKDFWRQAVTFRDELWPTKDMEKYLFEELGNFNRALRACQSGIVDLNARKLTFTLAQRRLEKCRLLKLLGRDFSREAKRLRRVAAKLKSQAHWEAKLAALEASAGSA